MSRARRRLTLQLTPLLDLLLIVIFAQYMTMQRSTAKVEEQYRVRAATEIAEAEEAQRLLAARLASAERDREAFRRELESRMQDLSEELKLSLASRQEVAELMAALFNIPPETIEKVLHQEERSPQEREQIRELVRRLADERTNEAVKHLLTHRAMQKRVDVWELFIDENGLAHLDAGRQQRTFRYRNTPSEEANRLKGMPLEQQLELIEGFEQKAAEEFANKLFDVYQDLPQPKDIVVLVVSWRQADRHWRKPALEGLERALRLMHRNNDGTQFVPAILGLEVQS